LGGAGKSVRKRTGPVGRGAGSTLHLEKSPESTRTEKIADANVGGLSGGHRTKTGGEG